MVRTPFSLVLQWTVWRAVFNNMLDVLPSIWDSKIGKAISPNI